MTFGSGHHLHLIDGSAYIFRAYHALPPLSRKSDGLPVGAVAGFCNILFRYLEGNKSGDAPTHLAVVFDHSSKTFRNAIYADYKAHRPEPPDDLRPQFPLTRDATRAFNIACIETEGYEADDIIASLSCKARDAGGRVTIISSDKDLMQLVGNGVGMLDPMKNRPIGPDEVFEKFGVEPARVVDVQALAGDPTDNVPGAPGIGIKTAALLIKEYGDLETLLARAGEIRQPKRREALEANADLIRISKRLVTLDCDTPLSVTLESLAVAPPDPGVLMAFLNLMEFRTLTRRVADSLHVDPPAAPEAAEAAPEAVPFDHAAYETVTDAGELRVWIDRIVERGHVAMEVQTDRLDEMQGEIVGISLCTHPGAACYVPLGHRTGADLLAERATGQSEAAEALGLLKPMLEDPSILKVALNAKRDLKVLAQHGIGLQSFDDPMLMSGVLFAGLHGHGLEVLADLFLNHVPIPVKQMTGTGKAQVGFDRVAIEGAAVYAAERADVILRLWQRLRGQLHASKVTTVYETLERALVPALAGMEMAGVEVDRDTLSRMSNAFSQKMAGLEDEIGKLAGRPFNIGSPKQLGEILFDEMSLPGGVRGKAGAWGTGVDVLEDLATEHELPGRVLDWRQISKLKTTYTDALQTHVNPDTGRVHTSYSQVNAATGRLSSTEPNLQNIPVRSEEGRRIREAFVAPEGRMLVSLDYSQIELRILAHVADIPALKQAFADGIDIHAMTAAEMFGVPVEGMDPGIRRQAKAINFGVIYGISGFGLARNLRIPREEAQAFIDRYFERFPQIRTYMDDTIAFAKAEGYVQTLFGRRIHAPEINARGPGAGNARRAAINAPIQGTAADIIRRAMVRMPEATRGVDAKMLLQVHDELLFEVAEDAVDTLIPIAKEIMEGAAAPAVHLTVPITVDAGRGRNWAEAH